MAPKEQFLPMTVAHNQAIDFMVYYPKYFETLKNSGLREFLAGTDGEILFLHLQILLRQNPSAGIGDLAGICTGPELDLVIKALLKSYWLHHPRADSEAAKSELEDLVAYLGNAEFRRESGQLNNLMLQAQEDGNLEVLDWLMKKKLQLLNLMHSYNSNT